MNFETEVKEKFDFLFAKQAFIIEKSTDHHVVYASADGMKVRFIQDRADFFLDFSCLGRAGKWIEFYIILDKLKDNGLISKDYKASNRMTHIKSYLEKYFPIIKQNRVLLKI